MGRMMVAEEIMVGDGTSDGVDVEWWGCGCENGYEIKKKDKKEKTKIKKGESREIVHGCRRLPTTTTPMLSMWW